MSSLIAWLDASSEEQRRMREIVHFFTDRESRDELGLGQIRDAISDGLFPGTSTLLTRARYLLFVPWCFQLAAGKVDPATAADKFERRLIDELRDSDDFAGLLGLQRGTALKTLPSVVYWTTIRAYGVTRDGVASRDEALEWRSDQAVGDDDTATTTSPWSSTLPAMPEGFPTNLTRGFRLTRDEAGWLRDRILERAPGTLMSHLAEQRPDSASSAPWFDEAALRVTGEPTALLHQARAFSTTMHGAALLYNLLLAEEYEAAGFTSVTGAVDDYRAALLSWEEQAAAARIADWRVDELWNWMAGAAHVHVVPRTRRFVDEWAQLVRSQGLRGTADDADARTFIRERERAHKGSGQARLGNRERLALWQGSSGAGALVFRWPQVRRILIDIHDGLESDA
ncbi:DUF6361 family protein [Pseudolysinimonas kribbensis]|uniref:DUF6361 family protein n=1 Tax=Pseudolysinimonas kribbensis TaxID=433641 RepID=UPI0024E16B06|nr:DUF6361 family protein [Pseudolysinimonas kribbensis]